MSTCQYQNTRYQTYQRDVDPNSENYGSYISDQNCSEPKVTPKALMNTERNRQTTKYMRDQRDYKEREYYTDPYKKCADVLGEKNGAVETCALTPALESDKGDGFENINYKYNTYGRANAAFTKVHTKEGNEESGVLKVNNPPELFKRGGRGHSHFLSTTSGRQFHKTINAQHDEKACALGIDQFCQTKTNPQFLSPPEERETRERIPQEEFNELNRQSNTRIFPRK